MIEEIKQEIRTYRKWVLIGRQEEAQEQLMKIKHLLKARALEIEQEAKGLEALYTETNKVTARRFMYLKK